MEKGKEIKVLDHGYVKLIDHMGTDESIIEAARMSTAKGFVSWAPYEICEKCNWVWYTDREIKTGGHLFCDGVKKNYPRGDSGLLEHLYKNKHMTPFEMCDLVIEVQAPIFVFREWHRHRTQCLAGDTEITCVSPRGTTYKRTIKQIFESKYGLPKILAPVLHKNGVSKAGTPVYRKARLDGRSYRKFYNCQTRILRVLNEATLEFTTSDMADVWQSGVKTVFSMAAGDLSVKASAEHPFFTKRGWVKLKDIVVGDEIARMGKVPLNERPIPPALRTGIGVWTSMMRSRIIGSNPTKCLTCKEIFSSEQLELDHIIPVSVDLKRALDETNLAPICIKCHRNKTNTEQPSRKGMTGRGVRWEVVRALPENLGEEMTYDIEVMGSHHNYCANDLVVHNSYNEFSARYSVMPNLHYLPNSDRLTPKKSANKQEASSEIIPADGSDFTGWTNADLQEVINTQQVDIYHDYEGMLAYGVPKEVARINTPVSRYSKMRAKANLRNWLGFLMLRKASDAQWEIRQYADAVGQIVEALWPRTYALFMEYDFEGLRLSRTERLYLKELLSKADSTAFDGMTSEIKKSLLKKING